MAARRRRGRASLRHPVQRAARAPGIGSAPQFFSEGAASKSVRGLPYAEWKSGLAADSDSPRLDNREPRRELVAEPAYGIEDCGGHRSARSRAGKRIRMTPRLFSPRAYSSVDELAEVFILGEQNPSVVQRELQHLVISNAWRDFSDGRDIAPRGAQSSHDGEVAAFIGDETHRLRLWVWLRRGEERGEENDFLVRDRIGRVGDRGPDVFARQPRISIEKLGVGGSLRELASTSSTVIRVPLMTGFPIITVGSISIRSVVTSA